MSSENPEGNEEFLTLFATESEEELDRIGVLLLGLERGENVIQELLRLFHTIKGNARMLGLAEISEAAHIAEDCLKGISEGHIKISARVMEFLIGAVDELRRAIKGNKKPNLDKLKGELQKLDNKDGEEKTLQPSPSSEQLIPELSTVRLESKRIDEFLRQVGELHSRINSTLKHVKNNRGVLAEASLSEAEREVKLLQSKLLESATLPLEKAFIRFPQMVRSISKELGKEAQLRLNVGDVKLDRAVLEALQEPLVHVLRNSLDHGIESPEERLRLGKPSTGTIEISAERLSDSVIVRVKDDGRGINEELVLAKAIEKGIVSAEQARIMTKEAVIELVFRSGFSTKEKPTQLSGRGVGMDIVYSSMKRVGGNVRIISEEGAGTQIEFKLPLTLSVLSSLLVTVGQNRFFIPQLRISKVIGMQQTGEYLLQQEPLVNVGLGEMLGVEHCPRLVLVYEYGNTLINIGVDEVIDRKEILITKPDPRLATIPGIGGSTILDSGEACLVLDLDTLIKEV